MIRVILAFTLAIAAIQISEIQGQVTSIIDGNTLEVTTADGEIYRVVLQGIDCPELKQDFGIEARDLLHKLTMDAEVVVHLHGKDRLKNYIGVIVTEGRGDIRLPLLQEGLAWTAEKDPQPELEIIRADAMGRKTGLWKKENPVPPWVFQREQSMLEAKSR